MLDNQTCPKCGTELINLQIDGEQRLACFKYGLSCDYVVPKEEVQVQDERVVTNLSEENETQKYPSPDMTQVITVPTDNTKLYRKPPLGVMPKKLWIEDRIHNLTRAMHEYAEFGDYSPIKIWADELVEHIEKVGE